MFDLPNWFWNTLAIIVFIAVNFILWLHCRRCKAKGIDPQPPFNRFKKHEKRISRWTDIFIIIIILLETIACGYAIYAVTNSLPQNISFEYQQDNSQLTLSVGLLLLLIYSASAITMASLLSAYQRNLTVIKRLELLVMCCTPLLLGILYCVVDNSHNYRFLLQTLAGQLIFRCLHQLAGNSVGAFILRILSGIAQKNPSAMVSVFGARRKKI